MKGDCPDLPLILQHQQNEGEKELGCALLFQKFLGQKLLEQQVTDIRPSCCTPAGPRLTLVLHHMASWLEFAIKSSFLLLEIRPGKAVGLQSAAKLIGFDGRY